MKKTLLRHKFLGMLLIIMLLIFGMITTIWFYRARQRQQASQIMEKVLKQQGYQRSQRYERESLKLTSNELFWGGYYEYGFADAKTIKESRQYFRYLHRNVKNVTLKNSPIIYRVSVYPPTDKIKRWTVRMYMDSADSANGTDGYIEHLNETSDQEIWHLR